MKKGIIYSYRNINNNKYYIGQTSQPLRRYNQHIIDSKEKSKNYFHNAIHKYGIESFEYIVILTITVSNIEYTNTMDMLESYYIKKYNSYNNGYNRTIGGGNTWATTNNRKKGITLSKEHKSKISKGLKLITRVYNNRELSNNNKAKKVLELDTNNNIVNTYNCGKEVAIKYNINYSTFKSRMKKNLIINNNRFIWN